MKVFFSSVLKVPLMVHLFYLNGNVQTNAQWENSTNKSRKTGHNTKLHTAVRNTYTMSAATEC